MSQRSHPIELATVEICVADPVGLGRWFAQAHARATVTQKNAVQLFGDAVVRRPPPIVPGYNVPNYWWRMRIWGDGNCMCAVAVNLQEDARFGDAGFLRLVPQDRGRPKNHSAPVPAAGVHVASFSGPRIELAIARGFPSKQELAICRQSLADALPMDTPDSGLVLVSLPEPIADFILDPEMRERLLLPPGTQATTGADPARSLFPTRRDRLQAVGPRPAGGGSGRSSAAAEPSDDPRVQELIEELERRSLRRASQG